MLSGMIQLSVCTFYYIVVDTVSQSRSLMDVYVIVRLKEVEDNLSSFFFVSCLYQSDFFFLLFFLFDIDVVKGKIKVRFSGRTLSFVFELGFSFCSMKVDHQH